MSSISSSPLSVCWRSGKQTLSKRFIEPNSAPSWKSTPNFLRTSKRRSSTMFGIDSPWTRTSPSSGYSRPTMCLMHTDLPVPDGPRIIEILSSGMPMLRPRRILLRPNALWTSTNSTASSVPGLADAAGVPAVLVVGVAAGGDQRARVLLAGRRRPGSCSGCTRPRSGRSSPCRAGRRAALAPPRSRARRTPRFSDVHLLGGDGRWCASARARRRPPRRARSDCCCARPSGGRRHVGAVLGARRRAAAAAAARRRPRPSCCGRRCPCPLIPRSVRGGSRPRTAASRSSRPGGPARC